MILNDVHRGIVKNKKRKRIGRGVGSGHGRYSTRGRNGAGSRAGSSPHPMFAGGQTRMWQRIPKRGFNNKWALTVVVVNLGDIDQAFEDGDVVTAEALDAKNLARGVFDELKILGDGELTKKLVIKAHRFSKSAVEKIEKAGATMEIVPGKTPVILKQRAAKLAKKEAAAKAKAAGAKV
jgi:large subunit ribosomal protein L15